MKIFRRVVVAVTGLALVGGCSTGAGNRNGGGPSEGPGAAPPPAFASSSAGPAATRSGLQKAVGELDECLSRKGVGLVDSGWDPVTQNRIVLSFPAPGLTDEQVTSVVDTCRSRHLDQVEARYIAAHPATMTAELIEAVSGCLTGRGIAAPRKPATADDFLEAVPPERHLDLEECAVGGLQRLYPGLPAFSFP